jgi:hypothetical protein
MASLLAQPPESHLGGAPSADGPDRDPQLTHEGGHGRVRRIARAIEHEVASPTAVVPSVSAASTTLRGAGP